MLESELLMADLVCIFNCMSDASFAVPFYPFGLEAQTKTGWLF